MTQQLPLILSLIALSLGGYSVVSQPSTGAVETDDVRVQALQEEMEALRKDLYAMKDSSGGAPPPPPPELARGEMKDDGFGGDSASGGPDPSMMPPPEPDPMGEMAGMIPDDAVPVDPMLAAQVRKIIREEREQYRDKRSGRHLERFAERLAERMADSEVVRDMSEEDRSALTEILRKERKSMSKLYRGIRSGSMSMKDARQELNDLRQDTLSIVRESMGDDLANLIPELSPLPSRGPLAPTRPSTSR